jgi:hypothetical protein
MRITSTQLNNPINTNRFLAPPPEALFLDRTIDTIHQSTHNNCQNNSLINRLISITVAATPLLLGSGLCFFLYKKNKAQKKLEKIHAALLRGERVEYTQGEYKKKNPLPVGQFLGKGSNGAVFIHRDNPNLVVKKPLRITRGIIPFERDQKVGRLLSSDPDPASEYFCKIYGNTYKKKGNGTASARLLMERLDATEALELVKTTSKEVVRTLIGQAREAALYVVKKRIIWDDVHEKNVMITKGPNPKLKMIDFGSWGVLESSKAYSYGTLAGVMYGAYRIVNMLFQLSNDTQHLIANSLYHMKYLDISDDNILNKREDHVTDQVVEQNVEMFFDEHLKMLSYQSQ